MKNTILKGLAIVVLVALGSAWAQNAEWYSAGGGKEGKTFYISTEADLKGLAQLVNSGFDDFSGKTIYLNANIVLKDAHTPIGNGEKSFMGIFDGNGKTISGLSVSGFTLAGLFGYVGAGGQIKNLTVNVLKIIANSNGYKIYAGGLAAIYLSRNAIENSTVNIKDSIFAPYPTMRWLGKTWATSGGLLGFADDSLEIINSYVTGKVSASGNSWAYSGGLVGYVCGSHYIDGLIKITNSHSTGKISSYGSYDFHSGGLVGYAGYTTITNSYATGDISGRYAGGLIGSANRVTITNSYATGNVSSFSGNSYSGGLVGTVNNIMIINSYATGKISSSGDLSSDVGGLVGNGFDEVKILNSYAKGDVSAFNRSGGLIGRGKTITIYDSYSEGNVSSARISGGLIGIAETIIIGDSYAKGNISATEKDAISGGLIGKAEKSSIIANSYASGTITGANKGGIMGFWKSGDNTSVYFNNKAGNITAVASLPAGFLGTGASPENLKKQETFKNWIFNEIWAIDTKKNNGYPYLRNERIANFGSDSVRKGSFVDLRDGKRYKSVKIGPLIWMAENLKYEAEGSKCYEDDPSNCRKYGRLYDWKTAKNACPSGWHLPIYVDWDKQGIYVGGNEVAGKKLKAKSGWNDDKSWYENKSGNGTDEYGFAALPDGSDFGYSRSEFGEYGGWWSSGESENGYAYCRVISNSSDDASWRNCDKSSFFSIRCVKDDAEQTDAEIQNQSELDASEATAKAAVAAVAPTELAAKAAAPDKIVPDIKAKTKDGSFTDSRDGKTYKTVKLGSQTLMAENLNYNANGSKCYNNNESYCQKYGRLYDWNSALNVCPKGWHLPSNKEWSVFVNLAGDKATAGNILKATSGWANNGNGTDAVGFSALPGGRGLPKGSFIAVGEYGVWWSASEKDASNAPALRIYYRNANVDYGNALKNSFHSVRCIQE